MPKIPLYNQGTGPTQGLAAGQLSPRASTAAFTAPGRAFAGFQQTLSKAGKVAADFALAEKDAQTRDAISNMKVETAQKWQEYNRADASQTVPEYQQNALVFQNELEQEFLGRHENFTKKQKQQLRQKFNEFSLSFSTSGANSAFNRHQVNRGLAKDKSIEATMDAIRTYAPNDPTAIFLKESLNEMFNEAALDGLKLSYNRQGVMKDLNQSAHITALNAAQTLEDYDKMRDDTLNDNSLSSSETSTRLSAIETAKNKRELEIQEETVDTFLGELFQAESDLLLDLTFSRKQILAGESITVNRLDGTSVDIDFSTLRPEYREKLVIKLEGEVQDIKKEANDSLILDLQSKSQTMSLSQLKAEELAVNNRTGIYASVDKPEVVGVLGSIISSQISDLQPRVRAKANGKVLDFNAKLAANRGVASKETNKLKDEILTLYTSAEMFDEAREFNIKATATSDASTIVNAIEFESQTVKAERIKELEQTFLNEGTVESQETYLAAIKLLEQRENLIENDFVGYYQKTTGQTFTPAELIEKQRSMGILPLDIRIASNAQIDDFMAKFRGTDNYREQSQIGEQFLAQFGDKDSPSRNIVMRHLHEKERITIVDQLVIAHPESSDMAAVKAYNTPDIIKELDSLVTGSRLTEIKEEASLITVDYNRSIIGSVRDGSFDPATRVSSVNHVANIQEVIINVAKGLVQYEAKEPKEAVQQAYNSVVGNYFVFPDEDRYGRKTKIRFPKILNNSAEKIATVLNLSIQRKENKDYLKSIIFFPPTPPGENEATYQEGYLRDLMTGGSWRTNVQTNGVFLVNDLGNIVPRKPELVEQGQEQYITVSFDDLQSVLINLPDDGPLDAQKQEFMKYLQGNQFF